MDGAVLQIVKGKLKMKYFFLIVMIVGLLVLVGCNQSAPRYEPWQVSDTQSTSTPSSDAKSKPALFLGEVPVEIIVSPTPDAIKPVPTLRADASIYTVKANDTLAKIALNHQVSVSQILAENQLDNPNLIEIGQELIIPPATINEEGSGMKIISDSELIYGPTAAGFALGDVIAQKGSYLLSYSEEIEGDVFSGADIIQRVADENSVNPRLLISLLEYQSHWLSEARPAENTIKYPMGFASAYREGLYKQLSWAANELNRGYYLWEQNRLAVWTLVDGAVFRINPTINNGTAGVQYLLGLLNGKQGWQMAVSEAGFQHTYLELFGNPFNNSMDLLLPEEILQPSFILPFEKDAAWYYTSGPHGGWNDGSPWAALDFAPPGEPMGCMISNSPVLAITSGKVVRTGNGAVVLDLDGDGIEQTGWTIHYMHIDSEGRIAEGSTVSAGDVIGYTSCEGGFSSATHLHIARRYNGVWVAAFGELPFVMDGWVPTSAGIEYDGFMEKEGIIVEAWNGQSTINQISR